MSVNYNSGTIQYAIQPGDSIWDIADKYNTSPEAIMTANPNIGSNLYIGQIISVPSNQPPVSAEQFRRFGPGFRPGFRRPFFRRRFPFRRFRRRPFFVPFEEFEEFEEPEEFFEPEEFEEFEEMSVSGLGRPFFWNGFWWS